MRTLSASTLAVLVLAGCLSFALPSLAGTPNSTGSAMVSEYEQHVPEHLRSLVTSERYERVRTSLDNLRGRYFGQGLLDIHMISVVAASPCSDSLAFLLDQFYTNPVVPKALDAAAAGMQDLPPAYSMPNPWEAAEDGRQLLGLMVPFFADWCTFLPRINGTHDNGLEYIQDFAWFYYHNEAGQAFVQGRNPLDPAEPLLTGLKFTQDFSKQRGMFMDSPVSTNFIEEWVSDPRIEIEDYQKYRAGDYKSWNEFFAREIIVDHESRTIPSRPATMPLKEYPKRDYIVVSPTDCIMNPLVQVLNEGRRVSRKLIDNPLQLNTVLDVKGIPISLDELLKGVDDKYRSRFVGGSGLSCVLMPNTYHHFHSPVNGRIVHAAVVSDGTYGYFDFPNWAPTSGDAGRPGSDFSQFQVFQRGVIIIEVKYTDLDGTALTGYVASVPVGLNTIGSVVLDKDIVPGKVVKRGYTRLGNFLYGGSLNILLFSKGLAGGAVQTRLGTQINLFDVGTSPE
ncbi:MAG: phosphatidylserine decarboxylase [Pseudomonadota bacterium]